MLNPQERQILLDTAFQSIDYGLQYAAPLPVDPPSYPLPLQQIRASFVTLEREGRLRGCIGMLEAMRPLVEDVAKNAYAAAFQDPRFPPLSQAEAKDLDVHISVLNPATAMNPASEQDLLEQLRPGQDGLILYDSRHQLKATFLPSVWDSLPDAKTFVEQLKMKAGLTADYWSDNLRFERYSTEGFSQSR